MNSPLTAPLLRPPREVLDEVQANADLRASAYVSLHHIQCRVTGRQLELIGKVSSYFLKQLAQAVLLKRFGGSLKIRNEIEVETVDEE